MNNTPVILVVDDHPKNVKLLEAHLVATSFKTLAAFDGEEALEIIKKSPPDLVLLDAMMPKLDGFEVCRRIKNDDSTRFIPVVMVTALDSIEDKVKAIEAGADDFLTKPVNRLELLARTKALIKNKRLNDQVLQLQSTVTSLFEITTFSKDYLERSVLFKEFAKRAAKLAMAESVAITLISDGTSQIEASFNLTDELWQQEMHGDNSATATVMRTGKMLMVDRNDEINLAKYGLYSGYIGVPFISFSKKTVGALHAFGISEPIASEGLRMLTIIAQRLGYELQLKDYNSELKEEVYKRTSELRQAMSDIKLANIDLWQAQAETIFRLAKAAEYRDEDTAAHLHRMSNYTYVVARHMKLDKEYCEQLKLAATMHDVGKIGTPDAILLKHGRLTPDEYDIMQGHTAIGAKILGGSSSDILRLSEIIAFSHHEKYDGTGYPQQKKATDIPLEARIVAIADVFDALTTKRVYKRAFTVQESLKILKRDSGSHFEPMVYEAFMAGLDEILAIKKRYPELD